MIEQGYIIVLLFIRAFRPLPFFGIAGIVTTPLTMLHLQLACTLDPAAPTRADDTNARVHAMSVFLSILPSLAWPINRQTNEHRRLTIASIVCPPPLSCSTARIL